MGMDVYGLFSEDKALGSVGANASTSNVDCGVGVDAFGATLANPDIGMGNPMFVNIIMTAAAAATGGAAETTFELWDDTNDSGYTMRLTTPAIAKATLVKGWRMSFAVPPGAARYLQVVNTVTTNNFTSGTYTAWLSHEPVPTI